MRTLITSYLASFALLILAVVCFDGTTFSAQAGTLTIKVLTAPGTALSGASVCYNSADGCAGSKGTSATDGNVAFQNVPVGDVTVKVSKTGFAPRTLTFQMTASNLLQQIILQQGSGGPLACQQVQVFGVGNTIIQSAKINGNAASTTDRAVNSTITVNGGAITAFRVAEAENGMTLLQSLQQKPFTTVACTQVGFSVTVGHKLNLRRVDNVRYGGRTVAFEVKSGTFTSNVVTDTIILEPVLKSYNLSDDAAVAQMFVFAKSQGFTVNTTAEDTCQNVSSCTNPDPDKLLQRSDRACSYSKINIFFQGGSLNPFWKLKSFTQNSSTSVVTVAVSQISSNVFRSTIKQTVPLMPDGQVGFVLPDQNLGVCLTDQRGSTPRTAVLEGPAEDDFVDVFNPWKNAFAKSK